MALCSGSRFDTGVGNLIPLGMTWMYCTNFSERIHFWLASSSKSRKLWPARLWPYDADELTIIVCFDYECPSQHHPLILLERVWQLCFQYPVGCQRHQNDAKMREERHRRSNNGKFPTFVKSFISISFDNFVSPRQASDSSEAMEAHGSYPNSKEAPGRWQRARELRKPQVSFTVCFPIF